MFFDVYNVDVWWECGFFDVFELKEKFYVLLI